MSLKCEDYTFVYADKGFRILIEESAIIKTDSNETNEVKDADLVLELTLIKSKNRKTSKNIKLILIDADDLMSKSFDKFNNSILGILDSDSLYRHIYSAVKVYENNQE